MKAFRLLITITLLQFLVTGCGKQEQQNESTEQSFTYAMSGLYKPFNYKKSGELVGFDVEIGEELSKRMGVKAAPITNPWETIIQGLKAEKYEAILGSMGITEKREEQVDFSIPYYRSGAQIFVKDDNNTIKSADDLNGKTIGVVNASTFKTIAEKLTDPSKVIGYESDVIALQDLTSSRVDAVITDQVVGFTAMKENNLKIKDVVDPLYVDRMAIAVRKGDAELLAAINKGLQEMIDDGTYEKISVKWFGRNILGE